MKHKRITTSSGRFIDIYDDVFPSYLRFHHIDYIQNSSYKLAFNANASLQHRDKTFFLSSYSKEDFDNFKFNNDELLAKLQDYNTFECSVLASSPLSTYYFHSDRLVDEGAISLLYYANVRWNKNWGGETLFANDDGECEIAIEYKPNRVVIFDSCIPHKPSPISVDADEFRFIFVIHTNPKINNTNQ